MTFVQWWCSGVVLNTLYASPRASRGGQHVRPVPTNTAVNQRAADPNPPQPTSPHTGKALDLAV
ncbi:MAG: hypothetical protein ABSG68_03410 [Thermoguttaceae bacterium]|jgi:hypothetical protein